MRGILITLPRRLCIHQKFTFHWGGTLDRDTQHNDIFKVTLMSIIIWMPIVR